MKKETYKKAALAVGAVATIAAVIKNKKQIGSYVAAKKSDLYGGVSKAKSKWDAVKGTKCASSEKVDEFSIDKNQIRARISALDVEINDIHNKSVSLAQRLADAREEHRQMMRLLES